jgi:hypothetical protein
MRSILVVVGLAAIALGPRAQAQLRPPSFTLRPVVGAVEDRFGNGLALTRDRVLVASYLEDTTGAASFYELATGTPSATLVSTAGSENDGFGLRVAASRRLVAIAGVRPPSVWVYDRHLRLLGAMPFAASQLDPCAWPTSLAIRQRRIAVGTACGVLLADWPDPLRPVERPAGNTDETFGWAVALRGRRLFVGSPHFLPAPATDGHVLAFDARSGALLWDTSIPGAGGFGAALAAGGSRLLVGAPGDDADGPDNGAVYLLDPATGAVRGRYSNPTGESGTGFGSAVAGDRRVVLVGAPSATIDEPGAGAGFLLDARTGALLETLAPEPNEADANAGRAVAVSRHRLLVGGSDWSGVGLVGVWAR